MICIEFNLLALKGDITVMDVVDWGLGYIICT